MKKKILSLMLAMVMMLSLSVTAFAAVGTDGGNGTYEDAESVSFNKIYSLDGVGTRPEATFTFTITPVSVEKNDALNVSDMPVIGTAVSGSTSGTLTATFDSDTYQLDSASELTATVTFDLPEVDVTGTGNVFPGVGVYTYTITETEVTTVAGLTSNVNSDEYTLIITVIYDEEISDYVRVVAIYNKNDVKVDGTLTSGDASFTNTYAANSLSVEKQVTGLYGDKTKDFTITVSFEAPEGTDWSAIGLDTTVSNSGKASVEDNGNGTYTLELKDDGKVTFLNIPDGVTYTVTEATDDADGYEVSYNTADGTDISTGDGTSSEGTTTSEITEVTVTNNKDGNVDTGISLDSLPYILMLIVVVAGVVVMISRRRLDNRF